MKFNFDIPEQMAHLRLDEKGYPIPFFAPIVDGKPNFKYQDTKKRDMCIERKLCPICGKKLPKDYSYIVSGPAGYKNGISSDAMMHRACAEFSMLACPHLHFERSERKVDVSPNPAMLPDKPGEIYLVKVSKFKGVYDAHTKAMLIHYKSVSAEKFVYRDNILVPDPGI